MQITSRVSAVIPAHNHAAYVEEALASIDGQSLTPAEVVVVDDGSTDGTAEVVAAHGRDGLVLLRQENQGAHHALNRAIEQARGPWIGILNSDDRWEAHHVEASLGIAGATGAALVVGQVRLIDGDGEELKADHPTVAWYRDALADAGRARSLEAVVREKNVAMTTSNFFLRRSLWAALGGFRPFRYVHDLDFLLRALALAPDRVAFAPEHVGVAYRIHGRNTISEDVPAALAERDGLLRDLNRPGRRIWTRLSRLWVAGRVAPSRAEASTPAAAPTADAATLRCGLVVPSLDAGGLEEVVALLAQGLPGHGIQVSVLCTEGGGAVAERLRRGGHDVTVGQTREARADWLRRARPQVLSTHFVEADTVDELADARVPVVEAIHNTYTWLSEEQWRGEARKAERAAGVVAVSPTAWAFYQRHVPQARLLAQVPNGVWPDRVCRVPRDFARRALRLPGQAPVMVQVGRLCEQKNQLGLIDAFRGVLERRPESVLVLVGPGEPSYADQVRERARDLGGSIRILPPSEEVGTILSAADAFVADSFFEGWSVAATEALWVGIPLVLSDCGGSRELVGEAGERGFVVDNPAADPARNRALLTERLLEVIDGRDRWWARADEIRGYARAHRSADHTARAYAEALRGVVEGKE